MINQYDESVQATKKKFFENQTLDASWKLEVDKKGQMTVHIKTNPENGLNINRIEINVEGVDFEKLFAFMSVMINRQIVDSEFSGNIVEKMDENTTIYYCKGKAPVMFVDPRDFVILSRIEKIADGEYMVINRSIEHPNHPPVKGVQRAEIIFSCARYQRISQTQTIITSISHIDPKGDLPKMVVNKGAIKGAEVQQKMIEYVKKN